MEAVNPAAGKSAQKACDPQSRKTERKMQPEAEPNVLLSEALEERSTRPEIIVVPQTEQVPQVDEVNVLEILEEEVPHEDLLERVIVRRRIPVESDEESSTDPDPILTTIDETGSVASDIVGDAKLFQEAATEYQLAYQSLDKKYSEQAVLVHEASEALKASQSCVEELQREMDALKQNRDSDIQLAARGTVLQYEQHLTSEQSQAQAQQSTIAELQGQIQVLQVSLSQRELPLVGATQEGENLREQIFNYVPGTVNTKRGAAVYDSPDQPYSFQKHVQFGYRPNQPDLEWDVATPITSTSPTTVLTQLPAHSLTLFHGVSQGPMKKTFDISSISPTNFGVPQDAAMITAGFGCSCSPGIERVPAYAGTENHQIAWWIFR